MQMEYVWIILISYLIGTSNMAVYVANLKKVDLKSGGSGNLGASNAMLLMGWKMGILVAVHDIAKAIVAVLICRHFFPDVEYCAVIAGVSCVLGHMYPFWMKFRGGKGFASYIGMSLALNWKLALLLMLAVLILTLVTDYIVVGTMFSIASVPIYHVILGNWIAAGIVAIASAAILYKHRKNLVRIANGTEIGLRSGHRGDHRVK